MSKTLLLFALVSMSSALLSERASAGSLSKSLSLLSWSCKNVDLKDGKPDAAAKKCLKEGGLYLATLQTQGCGFEKKMTLSRLKEFSSEGLADAKLFVPEKFLQTPENKAHLTVGGDAPCVVTRSETGGKQEISLECYAVSNSCHFVPVEKINTPYIAGMGCGHVFRYPDPKSKTADFGNLKVYSLNNLYSGTCIGGGPSSGAGSRPATSAPANH